MYKSAKMGSCCANMGCAQHCATQFARYVVMTYVKVLRVAHTLSARISPEKSKTCATAQLFDGTCLSDNDLRCCAVLRRGKSTRNICVFC